MTDQMTDEKPAPAPDAHPESRQGLLLPILIPLGSFAIIGVVLYGFSRVLLSITPHAATAVALIVAVSVMVVAIVVASRQRLSNGSLFSMVGSVAGIAMLAGGLAIVTIGAGEEEGGGGGDDSVGCTGSGSSGVPKVYQRGPATLPDPPLPHQRPLIRPKGAT